ncbi:hypothetical protein [Brevundimonas sp.]|uniref:hypothetical protein n=1 Tax=Brevundimonas sp. TaxID=1871086 RepID=UPI0035AF305B
MKLFAPLSLIWFAVTGVVVGLQMIPTAGVFMMILAAPLWSVATVNLAFIGIAAEAILFRWVSRRWLVLPAIWFGGYYAWAAVDHVSIRRAEAASLPTEQRIAFDPTRADLLITGSDAGRTAAELLHDYDLPLVYSMSPGPGSRTIAGDESVVAHHIAPIDACDALPPGQTVGGPSEVRREQRYLRGAPNAWCQYALETGPRRAIVQVQIVPETAELRYQRPRGVLPWFPMPTMGCGLDSNLLRWVCGYSFIRVPLRDQSLTGPAERLALRLNLAPRPGAGAPPG